MTKDEALKMAIEALEYFEIDYGACDLLLPSNFYKTLNACKEALEQPSVAELNPAPSWQGLSDAKKKGMWLNTDNISWRAFKETYLLIEQALKEKNNETT